MKQGTRNIYYGEVSSLIVRIIMSLSPRILLTGLIDIGSPLRSLVERTMTADFMEEWGSFDSCDVVPVSVSIRMSPRMRKVTETVDYKEDRINAIMTPCEACI